jgi:hypothetical protein
MFKKLLIIILLITIFTLVKADICRRCDKKGAVGRTCVADHECGNACAAFPRSPKWGINGDCDWGSCCCGADC